MQLADLEAKIAEAEEKRAAKRATTLARSLARDVRRAIADAKRSKRRAESPTALLRALEVGQGVTLTAYWQSNQLSQIIKQVRLRTGREFGTQHVPDGVRVVRWK